MALETEARLSELIQIMYIMSHFRLSESCQINAIHRVKDSPHSDNVGKKLNKIT